jgi:hypothetical protein
MKPPILMQFGNDLNELHGPAGRIYYTLSCI